VGAATKNADFGGFVGEEGVIFSTKIYRDHINILLSELGYSELVQRLFEKMTSSLVHPPISIQKKLFANCPLYGI